MSQMACFLSARMSKEQAGLGNLQSLFPLRRSALSADFLAAKDIFGIYRFMIPHLHL